MELLLEANKKKFRPREAKEMASGQRSHLSTQSGLE